VVVALAAERLEEDFPAGIRRLHHDDAESPKSPFTLATRGIEIFVVLSELPDDLRLAVFVLAEFATLDLDEVAELALRLLRVRYLTEGVRMDRVLELRLLPGIREAAPGTEPVECDVEPRELEFVGRASEASGWLGSSWRA